MASMSDDDYLFEGVFDYLNIKTLNYVDNFDKIYKIGKCIGKGSYGYVVEASNIKL